MFNNNLIITFTFLSPLQLGGMQFYLLHSGTWFDLLACRLLCQVFWCVIKIGHVTTRVAGTLFLPQNPQQRAHVNCSSTVGWKASMSAHSHL